MLIADVNIYLAAMFDGSPGHAELTTWLSSALNGRELFGVSELVLSAVIRIGTNPRAIRGAVVPSAALDFCDAVRMAPASTTVVAGDRHWDIFANLVRDTRARGNVVPDAYLAALAIENGATFVTRDRGFARFRGLRVIDPLDS